MRFVYLHFACRSTVGNRKKYFLVKLTTSMDKIGRQSGIGHSQGKDLNISPFLPLDIVFHILILLPADFLYYTARYVCKDWANIIRDPSFTKEHLLKSKSGLLIQEYTVPSRGVFLYMQDGNFSMTHVRRDFPGKPIDSCRGLCLFYMPYGRHRYFGRQWKITDDSRALYVVNPVTMQIGVLPPLGNGWVQYCHLAYILRTGQYVVVCLFKNCGIINGLVLTVGIDLSWRKLNLPLAGRIMDGVVHATSVVGEVLYLSQSSTEIIATNLYDETSCLFQLPNGISNTSYWILKMGENLSCLVPEESGLNIYVLRDSKKSEWAKICQITDAITRNRIPLFCLVPLGWLDNGPNIVLQSKLWCCRRRNFIIVVNTETGEATPLSFSNDGPFRYILIHVNSLIKW